jgi:PKD repeat protein
VNLALGKPATQSSIDSGNNADRAVDGNTNGNISGGSVAQTLTEVHPWWEVDLGEIVYIDNIQIYPRTDCCGETRSIDVFVSEVPFESHDFQKTRDQAAVTDLPTALIPGVGALANLQRTARYVRIQMPGDPPGNSETLRLAEVQVNGLQIPTNPKLAGQWTRIPDLHNSAGTLSLVHLSLLPSGKILFWGRDKGPETKPENVDDLDGSSDAYLWDMSVQDNATTLDIDERLTLVRNTKTNLFCAGHSFLPNGNLFVAGGSENPVDSSGVTHYEGDANGVRQTYIFDYIREVWIPGPDMHQRRWYPSLLTLGTGETLIMSGSFRTFNSSNQLVLNYDRDTEILGRDGTLRQMSDLPLDLPNYPFAHLRSDGNAFVVSGESGTGLFYSPSTQSWTRDTTVDLMASHAFGTSVMYDRGKIMVIGGLQGATSPTADTETIDLNVASPHWTSSTPMNFKRYYATSVLMPDGEIFVSGGSVCGGANNIQSQDGTCRVGAVLNPEIYDPTSQTWSIMARHQTVRMYHSVALLLPDATILVAGGGRPGAFGESGVLKYLAHREVEIFSPPYLFNADDTPATRPLITSSPNNIIYGQGFNVGVGNFTAAQIEQVVLVRLPSVTHALNFDQRRIVLAHQVVNQQTLSVTSPANGADGPPGPYMLFALGPNGVPSMAKMIFLVSDNPPVASFTISCAGLSCTANAGASSDDVGIASYQWNWGDSQTSSGGPTASHTFATDGNYSVTLTVSDGIGQTGSTARSVTVCNAAAITTQPTSNPKWIPSGGSSTLTIAVTGAPPVSVQWYMSTGAVVGSGLSISVSPTTNTVYHAVVSNSCGTVQSSNIQVNICTPGLGSAPTATPSTITSGQTSKLETGDATGQPTLTYLWYKSDGTLVGTSTNKTLRVSPTISTSYYYRVSNSCGTTPPSPTVTVTVQ